MRDKRLPDIMEYYSDDEQHEPNLEYGYRRKWIIEDEHRIIGSCWICGHYFTDSDIFLTYNQEMFCCQECLDVYIRLLEEG